MDFFVARLQRENIGRLLDPSLLIEKLDLLLAQPLNVEGAAGHEVLEMLDGLIRAGEFAAAAGDRSLLSGRRLFAYHLGVQMARTLRWKLIGPSAPRLFFYYVEHLRDHVAGPLNAHGIADADAE